MDKERFSLLLLEPNEIYFEDFSVNIINENEGDADEKSVGRLKICSKSIVYDPKDITKPLIKLCYKDCDNIYAHPGELKFNETNILAIQCSQYIEMLDNNILAPYKFKMENKLFLFNLHYAKVNVYLDQLLQLHRASSLHACEQNDMIATIVYSRHKRVKFDPLWLHDIFEIILCEYTVEEINPLILNPGRLLLSTASIYFQPYNNIQPYPVVKIRLDVIKNLTKRRFLLRHSSLEIKWQEEQEKTLFILFRNQSERDTFFTCCMEQETTNVDKTEPESMTLKWQNGIISNYDYLLYLNSLADRTFQDLTQYPVFPWIISDYKSKEIDLSDSSFYRDLTKPVGALNPERLSRLKDRYNEMGEPKFLYGSHYSAPGLVLFYLVRKYPKLMLCLQNGKFDHPDRMFNKMEDVYNNCLNNMSDFKELIPEFYDITKQGDFLVNQFKINFGIRHDGQPVNNVHLPPWAKGSPDNYVKILRESLESEYVSQNLNHWIDLIFGYKQRGTNAVQSDNLFYYLCYEGSIDLDKIHNLTARHAYEVQISEFGQIPKQLFDKPHVSKILSIPQSIQCNTDVVESDDKNSTEDNEFKMDIANTVINNLKFYDNFQSHKDIISCIILDTDKLISTGRDGLLKCYSIEEKRQTRSVSIGNLPLSCCLKLTNSTTIILGSWDNTIMTYNLDYGRVSNVIPAHDDAVSCLSLIDDIGVLISGSWDCSVKVWKGFDKTITSSFRLSDSMIAYLPLEEKISCVQSMYHDYSDNNLNIRIVIGTFIGEIILWTFTLDYQQSCIRNEIENNHVKVLGKHTDEITSVSFNSTGSKIASCSLDRSLNVIDVETGMLLFKKQFTHQLTCLNWKFNDDILFLCDDSGKLFIWNMITGTINKELQLFNGFTSSLAIDKDKKLIAIGGIDYSNVNIKIWSFI